MIRDTVLDPHVLAQDPAEWTEALDLPVSSEVMWGMASGTTTVSRCTSMMVASVYGIRALSVKEGARSRPMTLSISS